MILGDLSVPGKKIRLWRYCRYSGKHTKTPCKITMVAGNTHYFDWAIFNIHVKLPEDNRVTINGHATGTENKWRYRI